MNTRLFAAAPPLVRPSDLARHWELHPRTITTWIREGKLAAVRTPGNQFRLRAADVLAFCEKEKLAPPPFIAPPAARVILAGAGEPLRRAIARALRGERCSIEAHEDAMHGIFAAIAAPPAAIAIAVTKRIDAEAVVRAMRATAPTAELPIVVFDAVGAAACDALVRAGANVAIARARRDDVPRAVAQLFTSRGEPARGPE